MSKRIFTREQVEDLMNNPNISKCSDKAISYSKDFKIRAIKLYREGLTSKEIFKQAGFDLNVIGKDKPKWLMHAWNKTYKSKGEEGLKTEARGRDGGRPRKKYSTDTERIKWLEAENAYLKAENDFLAKLRAKRAE